MATLERIRRDIAELATRPRSVRLDEIERIVTHLGQLGYSVNVRQVRHGRLFRVEDKLFGATQHNPGSSQIRECYVRNFLEMMEELGLYEVEQ
jgi:hypothetical protein